ncbi:MAG TPA: hypothetical protein DCZ13_06090 [Porticoccaceae bacterium]|nr:hypothetical protein [Porticoccaceae bacterium]
MKNSESAMTVRMLLAVMSMAFGILLSGMVAAQPDSGQSGVNYETIAKAAAAGDPVQQYNYGVMHETGQGVQQSMAKAVEWYTKSAAQGYENAQYNLGVMYLRGLGVEKNVPQAIGWFEKAAAQQNLSAIEALQVLKKQQQQ